MPRAQTVDTSPNEGSKTMGMGFLRPSFFFQNWIHGPLFSLSLPVEPSSSELASSRELGGPWGAPWHLARQRSGGHWMFGPEISCYFSHNYLGSLPPWSPAMTGFLINMRPFNLNQNGPKRTALFICTYASGKECV